MKNGEAVMDKTEDIRTLLDEIWTTKEGHTIRYGDMTPRHLRNAAALIRRSILSEEQAIWAVYTSVGSDAAEYACECAIRGLPDRKEYIEELAEGMEAVAAYKEHMP